MKKNKNNEVAEVTNFVRKTEVTTKMNKINISDVVILSKKTELVAVEIKVNNISNEQIPELLKKQTWLNM